MGYVVVHADKTEEIAQNKDGLPTIIPIRILTDCGTRFEVLSFLELL